MSVVSIARRRESSGQQSFAEAAPSATIPLRLPRRDVGIARTLKRALDIGVSAALLLALSPVLVGTALAIKATSPGPVFFRQRRYGLNSEQFTRKVVDRP